MFAQNNGTFVPRCGFRVQRRDSCVLPVVISQPVATAYEAPLRECGWSGAAPQLAVTVMRQLRN
jgi:hypothetical protein